MLNDFFGQEDQRIELGNSLLERLDVAGYGFKEARQVLRGEIEPPAELATEIAQYILMTEEKAADQEFAATLPRGTDIRPAYGDYEATGQFEEDDFWG